MPKAARPRPVLLYWCDTTARQRIETGIQRVTRWLAHGLGQQSVEVVPVGWDAKRRLVVPLSGRASDVGRGDWLLVPEHPMTALADGVDPVQLGRALGVRTAALVHDLIPARCPDLYDDATQQLFRRYYRMFSQAELVFATTDLVAGQLRSHLDGAGLTMPTVKVVPLPAQLGGVSRHTVPNPEWRGEGPLRLLTVSTWEPRKNLLLLIRALALTEKRLQLPIELTLVGYRGAFPALDAELASQTATMPRVTTLHGISDEALAALYRSNHASIYPSVEEGFGLPILESLWLGAPCICHSGSSMAEVAPGGGTLMLDMMDEDALAGTLSHLVQNPSVLAVLSAEIQHRPLRSWADYARDLTSGLCASVRDVDRP